MSNTTLNPMRVALVLTLVLLGCRTTTIYNVHDAPYGSAAPQDLDRIEAAIRRAGSDLGWEIEDAGDRELTGTLRLRRHVAVVSITYGARSFSIQYVSGEHLLHQGNQIHRNYNNWIRNLEAAIRREVGGG